MRSASRARRRVRLRLACIGQRRRRPGQGDLPAGGVSKIANCHVRPSPSDLRTGRGPISGLCAAKASARADVSWTFTIAHRRAMTVGANVDGDAQDRLRRASPAARIRTRTRGRAGWLGRCDLAILPSIRRRGSPGDRRGQRARHPRAEATGVPSVMPRRRTRRSRPVPARIRSRSGRRAPVRDAADGMVGAPGFGRARPRPPRQAAPAAPNGLSMTMSQRPSAWRRRTSEVSPSRWIGAPSGPFASSVHFT